ncbi:M15 family metallopeptidase [Albidovulum sediminis]|uniref:M15 family metallopeptidase n=1 Tax=Albidovulum sediminis TaxID=3066345 RepID=A0ABT2NKJ1_9RHOB|nr:M15 family metallopeptidase [Defluviimonas sediminis]MCT8329437.1 M15 family metallopeptidase [Defluviimonas sediminis]
MRLLPAILIAVAILLAPVLWYVTPLVLGSEDEFGGPAVDSGARIEIEMLREQVEALRTTVEGLRGEVARIGAGPMATLPLDDQGFVDNSGPNSIIDSYAQVVLVAGRRELNTTLHAPTTDFLIDMFGHPREDYNEQCQPMTNPTLAELLVTEQVGPVQVKMLRPAAESLGEVFERIRQVDQDLYDRINTAGSLCVRFVRGSDTSLSSHAFGLSIDLNIDGHLDTLGDGQTQLGLTILADFFREAGWIWGAGFGREDSMHFEVSREKLEEWRAEGRI